MLARRRCDVSADLREPALEALEARVEAVVERVESDRHTLDGDRECTHALGGRRERGPGGLPTRGARLGAGVFAREVFAAQTL